MIIETEEKNVRHPEGKIQLKSGTILDCFTKTDQPAAIVQDKLSLDTTGEFLQVRNRSRKRLFEKKTLERPAWNSPVCPLHGNLEFLYAHQPALYGG